MPQAAMPEPAESEDEVEGEFPPGTIVRIFNKQGLFKVRRTVRRGGVTWVDMFGGRLNREMARSVPESLIHEATKAEQRRAEIALTTAQEKAEAVSRRRIGGRLNPSG